MIDVAKPQRRQEGLAGEHGFDLGNEEHVCSDSRGSDVNINNDSEKKC